VKIAGNSGQVRCSGRVSAVLGRWSMEYREAAYSLEATCWQTDDYWLSQPNQELRLQIGVRTYRLPAAVTCEGESLTAHGAGKLEEL
jgi:hypothetical protein